MISSGAGRLTSGVIVPQSSQALKPAPVTSNVEVSLTSS
jgi:hypothetical protein